MVSVIKVDYTVGENYTRKKKIVGEARCFFWSALSIFCAPRYVSLIQMISRLERTYRLRYKTASCGWPGWQTTKTS